MLYDFDQTISKLHLFEELGGGQLPTLSNLTQEELLAIFGGEERVTALHNHFALLRGANIAVSIISMNYVAVIKSALDRIGGLGQFFGAESIIGRDSALMRRSRHNKGRAIAALMKQNCFSYDQALFVDDTKKNIRQAQGICSTLHVSTMSGMSEANMRSIESCIDRVDVPRTPSLDAQPDNEVIELDMPPAVLKRTRSRFSANVSSCDGKDIMSSFSTMSETPYLFIDGMDSEEYDQSDADRTVMDDNDEPGELLSLVW